MNKFPSTLSKFYWSIIKQFPIFFTAIFFLNILNYLLDTVLFPYANKWAFEIFEITGSGKTDKIITLMSFIIINYLAILLFSLLSSFIKSRMEPIIERQVSYTLYNRVYSNDTEFFINRPAGEISNKTSEVQKHYMTTTVKFYSDITGIIIGSILISGTLLAMNMWMAIFVVTCGILRAGWVLIMQRPINKISKKLVDVSSNINGARTDSLGNFVTCRLFACEKYENKYIYTKQQKQIDLQKKKSVLSMMQFRLASFIFMAMQIGVVIFSYFLIKNGFITISDAAFAFVGARTFSSMFTKMSDTLKDFFEDRTKAKHAYTDIIRDVKITDILNAKALKIKNAKIEFNNISFQYGKQKVISNFNLLVNPGEKIGIVGLSGAGKTTLVNLILRIYDVKSGCIRIDNTDIRDVKQDSLRQQISFVPQESDLFNRTLFENISYAKPNATKAQVMAAAKKANIHDFIQELPMKYETIVGNRGIKLSGGQRQRIAIARAILKDAPILILDEATSALDSKNEILIQDALQKIMRGKTTIAIAHRLSTLRNMDKIIVIDKGKLIEIGTHNQLLKKHDGVYSKLWKMQSGGFIHKQL